MKKKNKTKSLLFIFIILFLIAIISGFLVIKSNLEIIHPNGENTTNIIINDNVFGKQVFEILEKNGIIKDSNIAYYYARLKGLNMDFKAGNYELPPLDDLEDVVSYLCDGNNAIQNIVTIKFAEGSRVKDFALLISENTCLNYDSLINYWNDTAAISYLMDYYPFLTKEIFKDDIKYLLEGYLFPDTYEFFYDSTEEEVTRKILDRTLDIFKKYMNEFEKSSYTIHEIFTLASIIQRESGNKEDMANVSSVFYNRLNLGMQLQSSVTVCYALDIGINEDWTKCEITQTDFDPYNTYQILGLPPGPICSPCEDAIHSALCPNETDYLFFIGDVCGDGTTYFAETYEQQLINQERYLTCY